MSDAQAQRPAHLEPSELGTKEYWDKLYALELSNHDVNPEDIGTVWFDDSDAEASIVKYLDGLACPSSSGGSGADDDADKAPPLSNTSLSSLSNKPLSSLSKQSSSLLDLGCGNGSLLLALRAAGWCGRALGVDYSWQAIALAQKVAAASSAPEGSSPGIVAPEFMHWDVVAGPLDAIVASPTSCRPGWDLVLDKGTFDAISLAQDVDAQGRRLADCYRDRVMRLVRSNGGLFLVTSCNWTEAELESWFVDPASAPNQRFAVAGRVKYKSFSFGGVKGQTISTMLFQKV